MKTSLFFYLTLILGLHCSAQNFRLILKGSNPIETKIIDSLIYNPNHKNTKSIQNEIERINKKLLEIGFIDTKYDFEVQQNDSSFVSSFQLGEKINFIHIYIGINPIAKNIPTLMGKEHLKIAYPDINTFLNQTIQLLEQKGFALAQLNLINVTRNKDQLYADLKIDINQQRILNAIIINIDKKNKKFPTSFAAQINRKYKNSIFNQSTVKQIYQDFQKFQFVNQVKYPEILFTKDSTKVYVYLEQKKSNTFDGFIGFTNNDSNTIKLNGYADIDLQNIIGIGERLSIYWKSDGNDQKTFNASIEIPYLLKSPLGLKAQIQLFRQDSTFQNTRTAVDLSYFKNYNTRFYLGYQTIVSSDIQNSSDISIGDFKNSFFTSSFNYSKQDSNSLIFPIQTQILLFAGIGSRQIANQEIENTKNNQSTFTVFASHNFYLNKKNIINVQNQSHYLQSDRYLINELYRFGGFNSIRGFAENSLRGSFTSSLLTEYRYLISPNLYLHSILDYCIYKNQTYTEQKTSINRLLAFGFGFGLQTKNGLLRFALANGKTENQQIKFLNTIAHISYNVKF